MKIKIIIITILCVILGIGAFGYFRYYYVFGEGVKSGELNYVVKKGYIFKTYEGKIIQNGLKSAPTNGGTIQSNEFIFSIEDENVALKLMEMGDRTVDLYYKEYFHTLPWRGNSVYVVDSFIVKNNETVKVSEILLNKNELQMKVGDKKRLNAAIYPEESGEKFSISWSSENNAVATVAPDGTITAMAEGETSIIASAGNISAKCFVTIDENGEEE
ncbi:MAG: Ig domain-containing protein [Paludibacteraceae bacterium]|nr:Ig domain-containing protein [Paludibacteraceae bacterium]